MANDKTGEVSDAAPEGLEVPSPDTSPGSGTLDLQIDGSYEQFREQRIRENRERMQKLGIVDLSAKLKSSSATAKRATRNLSAARKTPTRDPSLLASEPRRRSSRLQSVTPVSYEEPKPEKKVKKERIIMYEGSRPEFYTEEHEKLLGSTEMEWTLFVDGVGADGKRIYDPFKGKTCHQCRQKTLGHRTHCCKCQMVQGQFCGDCLYMRYGEHVLEAQKNPDWICPPCRGICNCSLCRQAKGWAPTGAMYKKIRKLEYKSVAHYLIETRRAPPATEPKEVKTPHSAKRSLAFVDGEVPGDGKEPCKKAIGGQKLDYGEKENDCQTNDIVVLHVAEDRGTTESAALKVEQDDNCGNTDISVLDVIRDKGTGDNEDSCNKNIQPEMEAANGDKGTGENKYPCDEIAQPEMEAAIGDKGTGENKSPCDEIAQPEIEGVNGDKGTGVNEVSCNKNIQSEMEVDNGHQVEVKNSPDCHAKKIASSPEVNVDSIGHRTRSRLKEEHPDASKAIVVYEVAATEVVISYNTPSAATKSPAVIVDSIGRRTRSRLKEEHPDASNAIVIYEAGATEVGISYNTPSAATKSGGRKRLSSARLDSHMDSIARRLRSRISVG